MTLVESWGRSVARRQPRSRCSSRDSARAALQLGAGAGVAAVAAPYVARRSRWRARASISATPSRIFAPIPTGRCRRSSRGRNGARTRVCASPVRSTTRAITKIVVHHTGTPNDITDYAGLCRSILANETAGEYIDIAYNWLIDPNGRIYEGRWAQDYPAGVAAHRRAQRRQRARRARDLPQLQHDRRSR